MPLGLLNEEGEHHASVTVQERLSKLERQVESLRTWQLTVVSAAAGAGIVITFTLTLLGVLSGIFKP